MRAIRLRTGQPRKLAPQTRVSILMLRALSATLRLDPLTLAPGRFGTESVYVPLACEMFAE
jgi:hypothetical protein